MCSNFIINGKIYGTIGDLSKIINMDKYYVNACYGDFQPSKHLDTCLCPIDHKKVAKIINQKVVSDGMDFYFGKDADKKLQKDPDYSWEIKI